MTDSSRTRRTVGELQRQLAVAEQLRRDELAVGRELRREREHLEEKAHGLLVEVKRLTAELDAVRENARRQVDSLTEEVERLREELADTNAKLDRTRPEPDIACTVRRTSARELLLAGEVRRALDAGEVPPPLALGSKPCVGCRMARPCGRA